MNYYLYNPQNDETLEWTEHGFYSPSEDIDLSGASLLVMGNAVNTVKVEMPIKQTKQIVKALPFALEDKLATEVEDNHIVYIDSKEGSAYALVADRELMEVISDKGLQAATSFGSILPAEKGKTIIATHQETFYLKSNELYSGCLPIKLLSFTLEQLRKEDSIGDDITLIELSQLDELQRAELNNLGFNVFEKSSSDLYESLKAGIPKALNLLTGEFKPKQVKANKQPFKFKAPLALAASFVLATLIGLGIQTKQTEAKVEAVKAASVNYYKKLFPGERVREKALKRQFRDAVGDGAIGTGGGSFTSLLATSTMDIKNNKNIELEAVRFNNSKSTLELNLVAGNVGQLEKLKKELTAKNLNVEIASANQSGGKIKGLIKVKANG